MKSFASGCAVALLLTGVPLERLLAREIPFLAGHVNDTAGVLSESTREALERLLTEHEAATSNQIVVLTIPALDGAVLEEYSLEVVESWKPGQKDRDNGVLLLVAVQDRKLRIEVGYGLEGDLTDALSSQIIRNEIVPRFRDGDFDGGIQAGVESIVGAIEGSYTTDDSASDSNEDVPWGARLMVLGIFLLVIGTFTFIAVFDKSWFLYVFLIPFYAVFPFVFLGFPGNLVLLGLYLSLVGAARLFLPKTTWGQNHYAAWQSTFSTRSSGSGGWSSGGSGGFSGGGGSFGGGGSSGSW